MPRKNLLQLRHGNSSDWTSINPILASGEPGYATDTKTLKIGDGINGWNSLSSFSQVDVVYTTGNQTINGIKTFSDIINVNGTGVSLSGHTHLVSDITNFGSGVSGLLPFNLVYTTGNQNISGIKTFYNNTNFSGALIGNSGFLNGLVINNNLYFNTNPDNNLLNFSDSFIIDSDSFLKIYGSNIGVISTEDDSIYGFTIGNSNIDNSNIGTVNPGIGNFTSLSINNTGVSVTGHKHIVSDITNFASGVSGLLPVTGIAAGYDISVTNNSGLYTIASTNLVHSDSQQPQGFVNRTDSRISVSGNIFRIAPTGSSYSFYNKGIKVTKTSGDSLTIPNLTQINYIHFDTINNQISNKTTPFDFSSDIPIAYIAWNSGVGPSGQMTFFAEERHGIVMDTSTHKWIHYTFGAQYVDGLSIGNYILDGDGSLNTHAQISISNGTLYQEDIEINITDSSSTDPFCQELSPIAQIPVYYHQGSTGQWVKNTATNYPVKYGVNGPQYNLLTGATWTTPDVSPDGQTKYFAVWILATNQIDDPIISIMGQRLDSNQIAAESNNSWSDVNLTNLPLSEVKPLYRLIFAGDADYTNVPKCTLLSILDIRVSVISTVAGVNQNDHGSLFGLGDDDHSQYLHVDNARTVNAIHTFANGLTSNGLISSTSGNFTQALSLNSTGVSITGHTHQIYEISNLQSTLNNKQPTGLYVSLTGIENISGVKTFIDNIIATGILQSPTGIFYKLISNGDFELNGIMNISAAASILANGPIIFNSNPYIVSGVGYFTSGLFVGTTGNAVPVSVSGHHHPYSEIDNFCTGVAECVNTPLLAGTGIILSFVSGTGLFIHFSGLSSSSYVTVTGNQTISGVKTFAQQIIATGGLSSVSGYFKDYLSLNGTGVSITGHSHQIYEITNLQTNLNNKQPTGVYVSLTGIESISGTKTFLNNVVVTGQFSSVSGYFKDYLGLNGTGVSITGHTHAIYQITNLQNSLDAKQNVLSNPITGTGTTNYIARFSSSSGLTNSSIFDNGTNTAIGTNPTTYRFTVAGSGRYIATSATGSLEVLNIDGGSTGFSGGNDANTEYSIRFDGCSYNVSAGIVQRVGAKIGMLKTGTWNETAGGLGTRGNLVFYTNNGTIASPALTEKMRITHDGNVGIGITTPSSHLYVNGSGYFASGLNIVGLLTSNSGNFINSLQVNGTGVSISGHTHSVSDITNFNTSVSGLFPSTLVYTTGQQTITGNKTFGGSTTTVFTTGAKVGIGTDSPSYLLDIYDDGTYYSPFRAIDANNNYIAIGPPEDGANIVRINGSDRIYLTTDNGNIYITGLMTINGQSVSQVALGSATNGQLLIGNGSSFSKSTLTAGTGISISNGSGTITINTIGLQSSLTNPVTGTGTTSYIPKWTSSSGIGNSLIFDNGTSVGISTSSISSSTKLEVNGTIQQTWTGSDTRFAMVYDNNYRMGINYVANQRIMQIFSTTADAGGHISFLTRLGAGSSSTDYGTERLRITNSGNVGIGTTSPTNKLHVVGNALVSSGFYVNARPLSDLPMLYVRSADASNAASSFMIQDSSYGVLFDIRNDGNAQIGGVDGLGLTHRFNIKGLTSDASAASLNIINSSGNSLFYARNDGNIGIGINSPVYKLDVVGSGRFSSGIVLNTIDSTSTLNINSNIDNANTINIGNGNSQINVGYWTFNGDSLTNTAGTITNQNVYVSSYIRGGNVNCGPFTTDIEYPLAVKADGLFGTAAFYDPSGDMKIFIDNSCNIGIGTDTPSASLHLVGTGIVGGDLSVSGTIFASTISGTDPVTISSSTASMIINDLTIFLQNNTHVDGYLRINNETADTIAVFNNDKDIVSLTSPTLTELSYVSGVSSNIQSQLDSKQAILTNPVTGTGIANHIAYWSSTSGLLADSSQLVWDSTNNRLGIGIASPSSILHISQNDAILKIGDATSNTNTGPRLELNSKFGATDTSAYLGYSYYGNKTYLQHGRAGIGGLELRSANGTARLYVDDNNGNIGIGTTSPSFLLDVSGIIRSSSYITANNEFRLNNAGFSRVATIDGGGGFAGGYNVYLSGTTPKHNSSGTLASYYYHSDGSIRFYSNQSQVADTNAFERMRIQNNGTINIGSLSPSGRLTIGSGIGSGANVNSTTDYNLVLHHSDMIIISPEDTSNNPVYTGITLLVSRPGAFQGGQTTLDFATRDRGNNFDRGVMARIVGGNATNAAANALLGGELSLQTAATGSSTPTNRLFINRDGNVGIGTTSPAHRLDVAGSTRLSNSGNAFLIVGGNALADHTFNINQGGNPTTNSGIGIYYGSDAAKLRGIIQHLGSSAGLVIANQGSAGGNNATNNIVFRNASGVSANYNTDATLIDRMTIRYDGNVGINTSSPTYLLDVNGSTRNHSLRVGSGNLDSIVFQSNGSGTSTRAITIQPKTLNANRTLNVPDANADIALTYNGNTISNGITVNQAMNTFRGNLGDPTAEELALFHGQFTNKFRFIPPTTQEQSTDGTTWTSGTVSVSALQDMMIGEGQGTYTSILPTGVIGTYNGYRLTWDVTDQTGYVFLNMLYIYWSTNGNTVGVKVEKYNQFNNLWSLVGSGNIGNYPGHTTFKHDAIPYHPSTTSPSTIKQVRITFETTHNSNTNSTDISSIEWFGGYPGGQRRNVESYDRSKNVTFPAAVNGTRFISSVTTGTAPIAVSSNTVCTNLNADLLDNLNASNFFQNATNVWQNSADGVGRFYFGANSRTYYKANDGHEFRKNNDGLSAVITNGGLVGINTATPSTYLHVNGQTTNFGSIYASGSTSSASIGLGNSDTVPFFANISAGDLASSVYGWGMFYRSTEGDFALSRKGGSTSWVRCLNIQRSNGYIGIGTGVQATAPPEMLTVDGNLRLADKAGSIGNKMQFNRGGGTANDYTIGKEGNHLAISTASDSSTQRFIELGHHNGATWTPRVRINGFNGDTTINNLQISTSGTTISSSATTTLWTIPITVSTANNYQLRVSAYNGTTSSSASWNVRGLAERNSTGNVIIVGDNIIEKWADSTFNATSVDIISSGTNIIVQATGFPATSTTVKMAISYL